MIKLKSGDLGKYILSGLLCFLGFSLSADDPPAWEGTVLPPKNAPDFVRKQWEDVVANAQFPLPQVDWQKVGLPPGLEEQVWNAWAPGAPTVWRSIGPGYMNVIYDAKIDNDVITLVLDLGGLVQSKDGGKTWRPASHHITNSQYYTFDVSPANPDIMAVGGYHIDFTLNGGRSWSPVCDQALPPFKPMMVVPGKPLSGSLVYGVIRFNADGSRVFASPGALGHDFIPRHGLENEMASWMKRKFIYVGDGKVSNFKAVELGPYAGIRYIVPHASNPDLAFASFSDGTIFVCRNARAANPRFTELARPDSIKSFQAICMDVSPDNPDTLLLSLIGQGDAGRNKSKLILATISGDKLDCRELTTESLSAKWNPRNSQQVFVINRNRKVLISDDELKSFRELPWPASAFPEEHTTGYKGLWKLEFDRKCGLAGVFSVTGGWLSRDQFRTVEDAVMTHDKEKQLFGNKGVAFQECVEYIGIRKNFTYYATTDHGAWRSNGPDTLNWHKISDNPGMPRSDSYRLANKMAVSEDESSIYLVARLKGWSSNSHKLMLSRDKGDTWQDITERLGRGPVVEKGIDRLFIDPSNSKNFWVIEAGTSTIFLSTDGGQSFRSAKPPSTWLQRGMAFDSAHKFLYLGSNEGLFRSTDLGMTWKNLPFDFAPYNVGALANGDLVVSDNGRLMVIPYAKIDAGKIEQDMIRLTIGDDVPSAAYGQRTFAPITCEGMDIIAIPASGWNHSNCVRDMGALLSRDGGKTFRWITYDLPSSKGTHNSFIAAIRNGKIILGCRGIHECDLNALEAREAAGK